MQISQKLIGLMVATLGMGGLVWLWFSGFDAPEPPREACKVLSVYDGDTIACDINGNGEIDKPEEQIRMLGIDSPEMHYSRKNKTYQSEYPQDEPYAKDASSMTDALTYKQMVYLSYDIERHDPYGRTLAYVYLNPEGGETVGEVLLREGYARVLFMGENRRLAKLYYAAEEEARLAGKGLWRSI